MPYLIDSYNGIGFIPKFRGLSSTPFGVALFSIFSASELHSGLFIFKSFGLGLVSYIVN